MEKGDNDVEENLKTTRIRNWLTAVTDWKEQRRIVLEAKIQNRLESLRRR